MNNNKTIHKIFKTIKEEEKRQTEGVELIASENYVSKNVLKATWSILTNKYAEGYSWKRYYGGCNNIDEIESLAIELAQKLFKTDYKVNVQPHSWSSANMWVYFSVLKPWDTIMWLELVSWWHLTHGAKPSFSGEKFWIFNSVSYWTDENGLLDYDAIEELALDIKPQMIVAGASAYAREIDFKRFKKIADKVGAYLLVDMAHIAWLVATWQHCSPFWIADFITTTTHKTLRGPRWWMIFSKTEELAKKVNSAIFPWIQGGPLEHIIAAKAVCFAEALDDSFIYYQKQVIKNAKKFEEIFKEKKINVKGKEKSIKIVTNWTDNHLLLLDFTELWISGKEVSELLEKINITTNMNTVPWDTTPFNPSWIRIWTPAITSRWIKEDWIEKIANSMISIIESYINNNENILEENINIHRNKMINLVKDLTIYPNS